MAGQPLWKALETLSWNQTVQIQADGDYSYFGPRKDATKFLDSSVTRRPVLSVDERPNGLLIKV